MSFRLSQEIIDEILCRFIVNLPKKELKTDRIFFHVQEAYWFYEDFVVPNKNQHAKITEKYFGQILLDRSPFRICDSRDYHRLYKEFHDYQSKIPVYGAILLNKTLDKVLLVMNYGQTNYSFPKGKINQNESELVCAAREVWEEIGFPITNLISEKVIRLFFVFLKRNSSLTGLYSNRASRPSNKQNVHLNGSWREFRVQNQDQRRNRDY